MSRIDRALPSAALSLLMVVTPELCAGQATAEVATATATRSTAEIDIPDEPQAIDPVMHMPQRLARPATVAFDNASLNEVVEWLNNDQHISTIVDAKQLEAAGVSLAEPVSDRLADEPLFLLLNRLESLNVAWLYRNDILRLTTGEVAAESFQTRTYPVGDLYDVGYDADKLIEAITDATSDTWKENDGVGGDISDIGDVLFIRQTDDAHREIGGLLAALRTPARRTFPFRDPQDLVIDETLSRSVSVDFRETPLIVALAELSQSSGLDLRIRTDAVREQKIRERSQVSITLADQPLRIILEVMLAPLNLSWYVDDRVVWIATGEVASEVLETAVFDVRDLCRDRDESNSLSTAIMNQTDGPWESVDGVGGTILFPRSGTMVVLNTSGQIDAVLRLLEDYRAALRQSKRRERPGEGPGAIVTRHYRMQTRIADDLARALPTLISPETWKSQDRPDAPGMVRQLASGTALLDAGGNIAVANANKSERAPAMVVEHSVLIIEQQRAVHAAIVELIRKIEHGDLPESSGGMGGGGFGGGLFSTPDAKPE